MTIKILKTDETLKDQGIVFLLFAESGVGKTTAIGEIPGKTLILAIDPGTAALSEKKIDYIKIETDLSNYKEVMDDVLNPKGLLEKYDNVAFDSVTALETNMLSAYARISSSQVPTLQNYGQVNARIQQALLDMRNIKFRNKNVIITALEQPLDEYMSDGRTISKLYPLLAAGKGKFSRKLVAECDIVGHLEISSKEGSEGTRFIRLGKTDNIMAKDRIFKREFCMPNAVFKKQEKKDAV